MGVCVCMWTAYAIFLLKIAIRLWCVCVCVFAGGISSGHDTYFYQLFMDKDDRVLLPTTQQLLELSFMQSDVKLSEVEMRFFCSLCSVVHASLIQLWLIPSGP